MIGFVSQSLALPSLCLWMALHTEKFPLLAGSLAATGVAREQRWAFILSRSARVSMVTCTTVMTVRFPKLDMQNDLTCFGNHLFGTQSTHGGFLPFGVSHQLLPGSEEPFGCRLG